MCNSTVSLSRPPEEIFKDIKDSVNELFDSEDVKKLYQNYFDTIIAEIREEYLASNTPMTDDSEIEKNKDLFLQYHLSNGWLKLVKAIAAFFDYLNYNPQGFSTEQIETYASRCLDQKNMFKVLELDLKKFEEMLKEIFRAIMLKR
ncbi:MAG: hypothetical protein IJO08_01825 [Clostridia bacterium]|nr:hypothetical protein [Clostridia bacterium]